MSEVTCWLCGAKAEYMVPVRIRSRRHGPKHVHHFLACVYFLLTPKRRKRARNA